MAFSRHKQDKEERGSKEGTENEKGDRWTHDVSQKVEIEDLNIEGISDHRLREIQWCKEKK